MGMVVGATNKGAERSGHDRMSRTLQRKFASSGNCDLFFFFRGRPDPRSRDYTTTITRTPRLAACRAASGEALLTLRLLD